MDIKNDLTNSIISNISESKLINEPFSHKFVENVFPNDFYNEFIANIPSKDLYVPIINTGSVDKEYSPERYIFNLLDKGERGKLNTQQNIFLKNY